MAIENLDEFEKKYQDIYSAVFRRGEKAGIETGRSIERGRAQLGLDAPDKNFESVVAEYIENGETSAAAIRLAVKNYSDLHTEYVGRLKAGKGEVRILQKARPIRKKAQNQGDLPNVNKHVVPATFENAVDLEKATGLSLAQATRAAVRKYPDMHKAYIEDLRKEGI